MCRAVSRPIALAVQTRHDAQRHVDAGRDARRREDVAVLDDVQRVLDGDPREALAHQVERAPVRRRAPAVEQTGLTEQQRAGADRGQRRHRAAARARSSRSAARCSSSAARPPPARDDQHVERRTLVERAIGRHLEAAGRDHDVAASRRPAAPRRATDPRAGAHRRAGSPRTPRRVRRSRAPRRRERPGSPTCCRSMVRPPSSWRARRGRRRARPRSSSTNSGGSFSGEPASNGGSGSYSMPSWMPRGQVVAGDALHEAERHVDAGRHARRGDDLAALDGARFRPARRRTPAAPRATPSASWRAALAAARRPPRMSEPVHTDVVHVVVRVHPAQPARASARARMHRRVAGAARAPSTMSAGVTSSMPCGRR